jgi:uncharacterized protein YciI
MLYHVRALDHSGSTDLRMANRAAHLDWINANLDIVKIAGPMLNEDESGPVGSVLLVEADTSMAAKSFLENDPYAKAGLFSSVEITPFVWVIGAP